MECYVEVTVLLGSTLIYFSQLVAAWMCHRCVNYRKLVASCWIAPVLACFGENSGWFALVLLAELSCAWYIFSFSLQGILLSWGVRFMIIACLLKLTMARVVNFQLFIPYENQSWVVVVVILFLFIVLLQRGGGVHMKQTNYLYSITIFTKGVQLQLSGYLDTGNNAVLSGYPVIFINSTYQSYFKSQETVELEIQTVQGNTKIKAYQAQIQIEDNKPQRVWLTMSDVLEGCGYDSLLNMECFTVHK